MSGNLGGSGTLATAPPPAVRLSRPGWRDLRLWVGILLVVGSVVAGTRVLAEVDETVAVWAAASDMGAGDTVSSGDLVVTRVRFGDADGLDHYFAAAEPVPADLLLVHGIAAGDLLPRSALAPARADGLVQLPVAVDAELVPPAVAAGSVVDLYLLSTSGGGRCPSSCSPVIERATVISVTSQEEGFGASGQRQLVLGVPDEVARRYFEAYGAAETPMVTVVRRG